MIDTRLQKLKKAMSSGHFFYVSNPADIFYFTGFSGSFSRLLVSENKNYFITDKRYAGVPEKTGIDKRCEIIITNNFRNEIKNILKGSRKIFIPPETPLVEYLYLVDLGFKPVIDDKISDIRMIKDDEEINTIKDAIKINEKGILHILSILKNNITEKELADEFEYYIKKAGGDSVSFTSIIAYGKNSSIPHHETGNDRLKENTLILIDSGVKYKGYCSDLTRIIGYRIIKSRLKAYLINYNIVKTAKNKSASFYKSGSLTKQPDIFIKNYLKKYGLDMFFTHSLGHGIGIDIHEKPYINQKSNLKFKPGMVATCEPGIYFQNEYGIRIEDDYLITNDAPVKLSKLSDEIIIKE
ncbi:MAG: aminopeptidase P family protein [Candidatus Goldbacteria bacterium]|nr:aminopeptidase P family protein [Candidatus Goldiibacteriota bacterium]